MTPTVGKICVGIFVILVSIGLFIVNKVWGKKRGYSVTRHLNNEIRKEEKKMGFK